MSNPFKTQFDSQCQGSCERTVDEGDFMYSHDGFFICEECAEEEGVVCKCRGYMKHGFKMCFDCLQKDKDTGVADDMLLQKTVIIKKVAGAKLKKGELVFEGKDGKVYPVKLKPRFNKERPLSWSAISSFEYNPEEWYKKYVLNEEQEPSKEMIFGSKIGKKIEKDPSFLPFVPRHSVMEHPFKVMFGKIPMIGYADSFCDITNKKLIEIKTGKKAWDQKRADTHGQIDMYLLMNYIINKIKPEEVEVQLVWLPTKDNGDFSISFVEPIEKNFKIFKTKRTMGDILKFGVKINRVYKEMESYALNHV